NRPLSTLVRHDDVTGDIDAVGLVRPVRLLQCPYDGNVGTRLELVAATDHVGTDDGLRRDEDLLLAVFVFHRHDLPVNTRDRGVDGGIRHGGAGPIPRPVSLARAALRLREDHHLDGLLAAVRLRHGADTDERARLHVRQRGLDDPEHCYLVRELYRHVTDLVGLDDDGGAVHPLDGPAQPDGLRLLSPGRGRGESYHEHSAGENPRYDMH